MSRFNLYLPPTGKVVLVGPESWRVDESLNGLYQVLLRIEVSDDKVGDTDLSSVGAGAGVIHGGAVAGFSLPVLKYYVANGDSPMPVVFSSKLELLQPDDQGWVDPKSQISFTWTNIENVLTYRFEVEDFQSTAIISAILPQGVNTYRAPPWLADRVGTRAVRWRVVAFDAKGAQIENTGWRALRLSQRTSER
jgi:hypothetical protein